MGDEAVENGTSQDVQSEDEWRQFALGDGECFKEVTKHYT